MPVGALGLGPDFVATVGIWERSAGGAHFAPRFVPVPGTEFAVLGRSDAQQEWSELARVGIPSPARIPHAVVEVIEPDLESVPANLLRFSISFSSPMEEGSAAGRIRLVDDAGAELVGALLDMPPELWDRHRRRLTVLLEPGRIKRGLQPHVLAGAPLRDGGTVTLVVDAGIHDASGVPLVTEVRRTYRVTAPIRSRVDPSRWQVRWPTAHPDPLVVRFDRPLDRALVQRCLRVLDASGDPVPGRVELDRDARVWQFTPAGVGGNWALHIDTRLEDLAGNSVRRVFDRDLDLPDDDGINDTEILLTPSVAS